MAAKFAAVEGDLLRNSASQWSRGGCTDATGTAIAALVERRAPLQWLEIDGDVTTLLVGGVRLVLRGAGDQCRPLRRRGRWRLTAVRWAALEPGAAACTLTFSRRFRRLTVRCDRVGR